MICWFRVWRLTGRNLKSWCTKENSNQLAKEGMNNPSNKDFVINCLILKLPNGRIEKFIARGEEEEGR
jgi:hypothetical protein